MHINSVKSTVFAKNHTRPSLQSNGSDKKLIQEFRYDAENDSRQGLYSLEENLGIPIKTKRRPENEDISKMGIPELNAELESNNSQMIGLINRRKQLLHYRKLKLKEQYQLRGVNINQNQQINRISGFIQNPQKGRRVLEELIRNIPIVQQRKIDEESKSREFWVINKKYENDIDIMLGKLKQVDFNLQKQTVEVANICKSLDAIEDTLKEVVHRRSEDQMKKAEPLFISKKKTQQILAIKVAQKQRIKDQKIDYIKNIKDSLMQLKDARDQRVEELYHLFGIDHGPDPESSVVFLMECTQNFEQLIRMKDRSSILDTQQREASHELQSLLKNEQNFYVELVKKQTQESRSFQNYYNLVLQKAKFNSIFSLFGKQLSNIDKQNYSTSQILIKHKIYKQLLKSLTEEDRLLKQALVRTNQTYRTFSNILKSTESEKERRRELLNILQSCAKLKQLEEQKKVHLRNMNVQTTKILQKKQQIEDQLQNIMTDGDLQSYKRIGQAMSMCESDIQKLNYQKRMIEDQIDHIDKQIVNIAESFKNEYADIIKDILPRDFQFSFKSSDDVKQVKNYIRKTYRRMGLQQQN